MNGHAYGRRIEPVEVDREVVEPPPADFMLSPLARPLGAAAGAQFGNCRKCALRVECNERVRKFGFFADMECEMAVQSRTSAGSGRRPARQAEELREQIVALMAGRPEGIATSEVAERLGLARSTTCSAMDRLEAQGRVRRDTSARPWRYFLVDERRSLIP